MAPRLGPQQLGGPGVDGEDDAARLERLQVLAQRLQLLRLCMRQHVAQCSAAGQRGRGAERLPWVGDSAYPVQGLTYAHRSAAAVSLECNSMLRSAAQHVARGATECPSGVMCSTATKLVHTDEARPHAGQACDAGQSCDADV